MLELLLSFFCSNLQEAPAARARAELEAGRLGSALALADHEGSSVERALIRAEAYFRAKDFPAVLQAAESGLRDDPDHLTLLWRAAAAELWLQDGTRAQGLLARLGRAVEQGRLDPEQRESWLVSIEELQKSADDLVQRADAAHRALERAQGAVAAIAVCLVLVVVRWSTNERG